MNLADIGRVWLFGCGNMGGALLHRWVAAGLTDVAVIDPSPRDLPAGVQSTSGPPPGEAPDILVVAVKPQSLAAAVGPLLPHLKPSTLVVSILAGTNTATLAETFEGRAVVRTMPNTPARLGLGVTALFAPGDGRDAADALMGAAGTNVWLDDEAQFDAVTAVSGSGPAYVFAMIEAMAAAGVAAGLSPALADVLALRTVTGAAALAGLGEATPTALREAVTSARGVTAEGLAVLMPGLAPLLAETVAAAARRSREMGEPV